jgi:predicted kinase
LYRPHLVIISGPPGAGKTSLAGPLARRLGYALLEKDVIKERLADALGPSAPEHSRPLGLGAILVLYDVARELLENGQAVVIESTFYKGTAEADLRPLVELANAVMIHVTADDEMLVSRYEQRDASGERHPVHTTPGRVDELRRNLASGATQPPDVTIPVIEIDTTYGPLDVEEIAFMIAELLEYQEPDPHA